MRLSAAPLIDAAGIAARVAAIGAEIRADYAGRNPLLVAVLKGALPFAADLARAIGEPAEIDFARAKSYDGDRSAGEVRFTLLPEIPLAGRHVIVVEDILDTGRTASALIARLAAEGPASLAVCTLLDKPSRRVAAVEARYMGFTIEDRFVVGYGLDYDERWRALPAIYTAEAGD